MKTLLTIIILFLSMNLMGQKTTAAGYEIITDVNNTVKLPVTRDTIIPLPAKTVINTEPIEKRIVELWDEYQIECKSDTGSLMWHQFEFLSAETREHMVMYKTINGRSFYHRKPTLEGYMLFIKRKITY